ncbi:unnamed protein product [Urochloa humidicola]
MSSARVSSLAPGDSPGDAPRPADEPPLAAQEYPRLASTSPPLLLNPADVAPRFIPIGATVPLPVRGLRHWRTRSPPARQRRPTNLQLEPRCGATKQSAPGVGGRQRSRRQHNRAAPGVSFPDLLLARFYCLAAPAGNWDPANCSALIWIVPSPPLSSEPDRQVVGEVLDLNFSAPPSRFVVRKAGPGIFVTAAASSTVANFIVLQGSCSSGSLRLALFPCLSQAESFLAGAAAGGNAAAPRASASNFKIQNPAFQGGCRSGPEAHGGSTEDSSEVAVSCSPTALINTLSQLGVQSKELECFRTHDPLPFPATASQFSFGMDVTELLSGSDGTQPSHCSTSSHPCVTAQMGTDTLPAAQSLQPSVRRATRPYLMALLSPPWGPLISEARHRLRRTLSLPPAQTHCFRCLGTDHLVAHCREPVRCRHCLCCGHRRPTCPRMAGSSSRSHSPSVNDGETAHPALTTVRPRTPPPVSLAPAAPVEQDTNDSGLRDALSQPRSSLPSLEDLIVEEEHEVSARRRRARRKRVVDSARKRRSRRLAEKEPAHFVSAIAKATSVKEAKLDMTAGSSSMTVAIEASGILQRPPPRRTAIHHLRRLGAACGINDLSALEEEEAASVA